MDNIVKTAQEWADAMYKHGTTIGKLTLAARILTELNLTDEEAVKIKELAYEED